MTLLKYLVDDSEDGCNYRQISVILTIAKMFGSIVLKRLTECLNNNSIKNQSGFGKKTYSTAIY